MTRSVSQASRRNFQTPIRLCKVYSSAKVRSRVYCPNDLVKRLDTHQSVTQSCFQSGVQSVFKSLLQRYVSRRFCTDSKSKKSDPLHPSGRRDILSGCSTVQAPSIRTTRTFYRDFLCVEKLQIAPACIRLDVSATRPDATQCSIKL